MKFACAALAVYIYSSMLGLAVCRSSLPSEFRFGGLSERLKA